MNRAYKYRMYPDKDQEALIQKTFGHCRKIWNLMLESRQDQYRRTGSSATPSPASFKKDYPYLKEADSLALANVQLNVDRAFKAFFERRSGYPRFKSKKYSKRSYTTNNLSNSIRFEGGKLRLPKLGFVKVRIHRDPPGDGWILKSATVSQDSSGAFYVSILYFHEDAALNPPDPECVSHVGLDYASDGLYVDSEGCCAGMPKYYKESLEKYRKLSRRLSRKKEGSKNREKAGKKLGKLAAHISNQRKDFLHKESAVIAKRYDVVSAEDLSLKGISRGLRGQGRAVHDNGYAMFLTFLEYKLVQKGGVLIRVDRFYPSSQLCSGCGYKDPSMKDLKKRTYVCPACGMILDRDHNAARNVDGEGMRLLLEGAV